MTASEIYYCFHAAMVFLTGIPTLLLLKKKKELFRKGLLTAKILCYCFIMVFLLLPIEISNVEYGYAHWFWLELWLLAIPVLLLLYYISVIFYKKKKFFFVLTELLLPCLFIVIGLPMSNWILPIIAGIYLLLNIFAVLYRFSY